MATYYTQYQIPQAYNFPIFTEWNNILSTVQIPNLYAPPIQHLPMPLPLVTPQVTPICPFTGVMIAAEPTLVTIAQNALAPDQIVTICDQDFGNILKPEIGITEEQVTNEVFDDKRHYTDKSALAKISETTAEFTEDPIEIYLSLPKELYPSARLFPIDPNQMIDEFCKIANVNENVPWILDVEFGVPRVPVTRAIASYNVKFNSINCKNTPSAIHPGFEKCNEDLKKVVLFYYDCIVSTWYKGYMIMNYDKSVENFQSWLLIPMQMFGMCWS